MSVACRRLLRAYVDETGDRGFRSKSSPFFAFAGFVIADEDEPLMRAAVSSLRREFSIAPPKALHWSEHVKKFQRRQHVRKTLEKLPLQVIYVVVEKSAVPSTAKMRSDHVTFYNYAAGIMLERLLKSAQGWNGGARDIKVRFGHVRGFNHQSTLSYIQKKTVDDPTWMPWGLLQSPVSFDQQNQWDGLQAADQYAGMLHTAICPDPFGGYEEAHLLGIRHQIRRDPSGESWGWGFKILGNAPTFTGLPWWPPSGL